VPSPLRPLAFCLLLAGCATDSQFASDPLLGEAPAPRQTAPPPLAPVRQAAVPPMSAPTGSTSPAALASGGGVERLEPWPAARVVGRTGNPPAWKGETPPPGAVLQAPQPIPDGAARFETAPGFTLVGGVRALTYEQAQAMLAAYGVTWQRLESGTEPGEWKFSCSIPNRQNANIRRFYESRAGDPLAALRAVIEQIEKERN
jgi:hypothetical protein